MRRSYYKIFLSGLLILTVGILSVLSIQAETPTPAIADATPVRIEPTASPEPTGEAGPTAASGTYYNKGDVEEFDGTPDGTGNSAGEIVFMLAIFLVCLFFVVEAIVHWIRKQKRNSVRPDDDWRKP